MKRLLLPIPAMVTLGILLATAPASAQATRTWVSGVGDDANPCSRTAPCKTLAGAISKTATKGVISILDPGGFGTLTITKSITIDGSMVPGGVLAAGTNGMLINTSSATDVVILRHIALDGAGTGNTGVVVTGTLAALHIENCRISNFSQRAIDFRPANAGSAVVSVTNSEFVNNVKAALFVSGSGTRAMVDSSHFSANGSSVRAAGGSRVAVRASTMNGGINGAVLAEGGSLVSVAYSTVAAGVWGLVANSGGTVIASGTDIIANTNGGLGGDGSGALLSGGGNRLAANGAAAGSFASFTGTADVQ